MDLYLARPSHGDHEEFVCMMQEWEAAGERVIPGILKYYAPDFRDFLALLDRCHEGAGLTEGQVPSTLYLLKDETGYLYGATLIKHQLNDALQYYGGHISYGIRPRDRGRGYGRTLLNLALKKAGKLGLKKVQISCDKENIVSMKMIQSCGGVLDYEGFYEPAGRQILRYWIDLT